jgi:hypothetical protein
MNIYTVLVLLSAPFSIYTAYCFGGWLGKAISKGGKI